jgi:hypothetical protein
MAQSNLKELSELIQQQGKLQEQLSELDRRGSSLRSALAKDEFKKLVESRAEFLELFLILF